MHCSYCGEADHNTRGCKHKKAGLPPPRAGSVTNQEQGPGSVTNPEQGAGSVPNPEQGADSVTNPEQTATSTEVDPVLTQDHQEPSATYEDPMVDKMIAQMPIPRVVEQRPLPSSSFLNAAQVVLNQSLDGQGSQASSNTIRPGELAQKLEAMKNQRDRELEERKQAILASRRQEELRRAKR
ncbi:hypothetical protein D1007_56630 [Hordeum vulgare]|nr:hypothetical protein D1007_56630 [Hordeum vulgare]